eukprot:8711-Heterococcus_DN1.PRE.1
MMVCTPDGAIIAAYTAARLTCTEQYSQASTQHTLTCMPMLKSWSLSAMRATAAASTSTPGAVTAIFATCTAIVRVTCTLKLLLLPFSSAVTKTACCVLPTICTHDVLVRTCSSLAFTTSQAIDEARTDWHALNSGKHIGVQFHLVDIVTVDFVSSLLDHEVA